MSVKNEFVQNETGAPVTKPSKKRKCMGHCKRFWWVYLIVAIALIVLIVCLIIFVAVPKIAQSKIDDAKLEIQSVKILNAKSDSYTMEIASTIETDGSIHANVDAFTGRMYLEDLEEHRTFAAVEFPPTNADKHQTVNISQEVMITDMEAFTQFNTWFVNNKTLRITVEGDTHVKPKGLSRKYKVNFKKTLEINALNLLAGTQVTEGEISLEPDDLGRNFHGKSKIPNASSFTLDIGNVSFVNYVGDEELGYLFINNLVLAPGDNIVDVSASMDQIAILTLIQSPEYCDGKTLVPLKLLGNNVTNNGQNLTYFADSLASANQTVPINIKSIIEEGLGTTLSCKD